MIQHILKVSIVLLVWLFGNLAVAYSLPQDESRGPLPYSVVYIESSLEQKEQLWEALLKENLPGFHLFSHGRPGELFIEGEWKNPVEIVDWLNNQEIWEGKSALYLYGCEFAKGEKGRKAVEFLKNSLHISVAASNDLTGKDGDWDLEIGNLSGSLSFPSYPFTLQDTDGDGVNDSSDLDDDNDGITDIRELPSGSLSYEFYDGAPSGLTVDNIPTSGALATGTVSDFDVNTLQNAVDPGDTDSYGIRYTGYIYISTPGLHTFETSSDDGSKVFLNGVEVVDNDGDHGVQSRSGTVTLSVGLHEVTILFYENGGGSSLSVSHQPPSGSLTALSFSNLYLDSDPDGDGLSNHLDLDSDGDGIADIIEADGTDSDGDGQVDYGTAGDPSTMTDADGDGLADALDNVDSGSGGGEVTSGTAWIYGDSDSDDYKDALDIDSDNDGITDNVEAQTSSGYTVPTGSDTDGDGVDDAYDGDDHTTTGIGGGTGTALSPTDTDSDATADYRDSDSDNDGKNDVVEGHDTNGDGTVDGSDSPNANTGLAGGTTDADADGLLDGFDNNTSSFDPTNGSLTAESHPDVLLGSSEQDWRENNDFDRDGILNSNDLDDDNDGIPDYVEKYGTDNPISTIYVNEVSELSVVENLDATPSVTSIGTLTNTYGDIGLGLDETLYGIVFSNGTTVTLYEIDKSNANETSLGTISSVPGLQTPNILANALAFDSKGMGYFGSAHYNGGITNPYFWSFDPTDLASGASIWMDYSGLSSTLGSTGLTSSGDILFVSPTIAYASIRNWSNNNDYLVEVALNASGNPTSQTVLGQLPSNSYGLAADAEGNVYCIGDDPSNSNNSSLFEVTIPNSPVGGGTGALTVTVLSNTGIASSQGIYGATGNYEALLGGIDTDGDGLSDYLDLDSDDDGIADIIEAGGTDSDGDGQVLYDTAGDPSTLVDSDNDGLSDAVDDQDSGSGGGEVTSGTAWTNPDTDSDGLNNVVDIDSDNDGITDNVEAQTTSGYTAPSGSDTDGDGIDNAYDGDDNTTTGIGGGTGTAISPTDTDSDATADYRDSDSDNDGVNDVVEGHDTNGDGTVDGSDSPNANTGLAGGTTDADGDGLYDGFDNNTSSWDATNNSLTAESHPDVKFGTTEQDWREGLDSDRDGVTDVNDLDDDNDGIPDIDELPSGSLIYEFYDGATTGNTVDNIPTSGALATGTISDFDVATLQNALDPGDVDTYSIRYTGYINITTPGLHTFETSSDDGSKLFVDGAEVLDNDGIHGTETQSGTVTLSAGLHRITILFFENTGSNVLGVNHQPPGGSLAALSFSNLYIDSDPDGDGISNHLDLDSDGDGIADIIEAGGTDSDGDGQVLYDTAGDPSTLVDLDNDGLSDAVDDQDSGSGGGEVTNGTPWTNPDTDSDGLNNVVDIDSDNDGITDNVEAQSTSGYTAPSGSDTDGDGIDNAYDGDDNTTTGIGGGTGTATSPVDTESDGTADYLDSDSDGDGVNDVVEGHDTNGDGTIDGSDSPNANTGLAGGTTDADADGLLDGFDNNTSSFDPTNGSLTAESHPDVQGGTAEQDWREGIDSDGDGIVDLYDLDDDNDGIPDLDECATNHALTGTASQSSNYNGTLTADKANDGNTGYPETHTSNSTAYEWWEIDLGSAVTIDEIVIWNRTVCCTDRLSNMYVMVSSTAFPANTTLSESLSNSEYTYQLGDMDGVEKVQIPIGRDARYLRIQKSGTNPGGDYINFYELQVIEYTSCDMDQDGVPNYLDLDSDNDGIPDLVEAGGTDSDGDGKVDSATDTDGDGLVDTYDNNDSDGPGVSGCSLGTDCNLVASTSTLLDTDNDGTNDNDRDEDSDGYANFIDIDADGDGITDNNEAQASSSYVAPSGADTDGDGIDDAYDVDCSPCGGVTGVQVSPVNTDEEADNPDYLDTDSDEDGESDTIEAYDTNNDGSADTSPAGTDSDGDGLDDNFDSNVLSSAASTNANNNGESPSGFPDSENVGGEPNWREFSGSLPVEFLSFSVYSLSNGTVKIRWQTLTETHNDFFTLERSRDAENWEEFAYVKGAGNSQETLSYQEIDPQPYLETSYYRLKQTDFNGDFTYSQIMDIYMDPGRVMPLEVYPNPTRGALSIEGAPDELTSFTFYDVTGKDVTAQVRLIDRTDFLIRVDISKLPRGVYLLKTENETVKVERE